MDAAGEDAKAVAEEVDAKETEELRAALGAASGTGGRMPRGTAGVMKDLADRQKRRATRTQRDTLDLALTDLAGFYRDVLNLQLGGSPTASPTSTSSTASSRSPPPPGPSTACAASTRCSPAARPSTATWRRCSPSRP